MSVDLSRPWDRWTDRPVNNHNLPHASMRDIAPKLHLNIRSTVRNGRALQACSIARSSFCLPLPSVNRSKSRRSRKARTRTSNNTIIAVTLRNWHSRFRTRRRTYQVIKVKHLMITKNTITIKTVSEILAKCVYIPPLINHVSYLTENRRIPSARFRIPTSF